MSTKKPDVVIPEEATERGSIISGGLQSKAGRVPAMLAQFSKIDPGSRRARIYFYPSVDQARNIFGVPPPFSFEGTVATRDGVEEQWKATGIWIKPGSRITYNEALYWTACSGDIENLHIITTSRGGNSKDFRPFAWFVMNRCFLLQALANREEDELADAKRYGFPERSFTIDLSDGATAEIRRRVQFHKFGVAREETKTGYSLCVRDFKDEERVKNDVEAILILASFASRERTMLSHWSTEWISGNHHSHWLFNIPKFPKRQERIEPLVPRDHAQCAKFLTDAFRVYRSAKHRELFDAAVYALLSHKLPLETEIVRLFSGIQSALVFALQEPKAAKRPRVRALYEKLIKKYSLDLSDLWPLLSKSSGASLSDIRNAAVHGEVFTESDWLALSYAGENLRWMLERILLVSLGWDIQASAVSPQKLRLFYAHKWQAEQQKIKV